jgi:cell division protein FtsZ
VDPDANIIVGSTFDERLNGRMRVSVVATGIAIETKTANQPSRQTQAADATRSKVAPAADASAPQVSAEEKRPVIVQAPIVSVVATPPSEVRAGSPVHDMQDGIVRSGIAASGAAPSAEPMVCPPVQRGYSDYDTNAFDPELVASLGAAIRNVRSSEPARTRMEAPLVTPSHQAEPRKSSGFSVFGITIGGSSASKRPVSVARTPSSSPSTARLGASGSGSSENGRITASPLREGSLSKEKSEELLKSMSDDQLDIPAFLRRQVN